MTEQKDNVRDKKQLIDHLNRQISELKNQVKSASLEMEMMRARMNDLSRDAKQSVQIERFSIPDPDRRREINEIVDLMDKAIKKNRRSRKAKAEKTGPAESTSPRKLDERMILIVLKLRRKGCYIQEIASHVGLAHGTIHNIIRRYGSDPQMQSLITEGTQLEISDYLLIRTDETDREK